MINSLTVFSRLPLECDVSSIRPCLDLDIDFYQCPDVCIKPQLFCTLSPLRHDQHLIQPKMTMHSSPIRENLLVLILQIQHGCIVNFNTCNVARIFSIAFIVFVDKTISSCNPHIIDLSKVEFGSHSNSVYNSSISDFCVSNWVRR